MRFCWFLIIFMINKSLFLWVLVIWGDCCWLLPIFWFWLFFCWIFMYCHSSVTLNTKNAWNRTEFHGFPKNWPPEFLVEAKLVSWIWRFTFRGRKYEKLLKHVYLPDVSSESYIFYMIFHVIAYLCFSNYSDTLSYKRVVPGSFKRDLHKFGQLETC